MTEKGPSAVGAQPAARAAARPRWRKADRLVWALYAAAILALLAGAVHPVREAVESRRQALLGYRESPGRRLALAQDFAFQSAAGASYRMVPGAPLLAIEDLPAEAVMTVLGGFRGPYAVYLWIQVEEEKHRRHHFDLVDRYSKIAALQPDYAQVWVFHMWNLAWNVSVQWHSLEHKYQWVRRAIDFGQEGHRRNPRNAEIMASIGRVYLDKLGLSQEGPYYRRRVREDEGRSAFLAAYEWYDRARKANDLYGTLGRGLSPTVVYSQACHAVTCLATEATLGAWAALESSVQVEKDTRCRFPEGPEGCCAETTPGVFFDPEAASRDRLAAGLRGLDEAIAAWAWAVREWRDHSLRAERDEAPAVLREVYVRFYNDAVRTERALRRFRSALSYDNLPRYGAAALTEDALLALEESLERRASGRPASARESFREGQARLAEAADAWRRAVEEARAAVERLSAQGAPEETLRPWQEALQQDTAFLADLERFRAQVAYDDLPRYRAAALMQQARTAFEDCLAAQQAQQEEAAREAFGRGRAALRAAVEAWQRARQEAQETLARLQKQGAPPAEMAAAQARLEEAARQAAAVATVGQALTYQNLPEHLSKIEPPAAQWPRPPVTWPARDLRL